ncbi:MAG: FGGY family carbohydrate kinase [Candidatus Caldatribacteriaceae bacterium]
MALLTFDVGTSAVKVALFSGDGTLLRSSATPLATRVEGRKVTQDPETWWEGFLRGARECLREFHSGELAIVGTGQMEDLLLLDEEGRPLREASLYSDSDIGDYVLPEALKQSLERKIPNRLDSFTPLVKVMALRSSPLFQQVRFLVLGAKDYLNFRLTGNSVTDPTNAATTGFLDCRTLRWVEDAQPFFPLLPTLSWPTATIGKVQNDVLPLLGLGEELEVPVLNGIGDLGAVTLGAGILSPGEGYGYLGTTGWMAFLAGEPAANQDLFSLSFLREGEWVVVAPLLNLGNAYQWSMRTFLQSSDYAESEAALSRYLDTPVQVWPYLNGERAPYRNERVRAIMARFNEGTTPEELHAAFVRSLLFALRHAYEALRVDIPVLRLTGGLTRGEALVQYLSDVLQKPCQVVPEDAFAPQRGLYRLFCLAQGVGPPSVSVERIYMPRENPILIQRYREYRDFAETLLQGVVKVPAYL